MSDSRFDQLMDTVKECEEMRIVDSAIRAYDELILEVQI